MFIEKTMASKKSAAQIRRMERRAQQRGQTYQHIKPDNVPVAVDTPCSVVSIEKQDECQEDKLKYEVACELEATLQELEQNPLGLNSKDKRTARRKAEALAMQKIKEGNLCDKDSGMSCLDAVQLLAWLEKNKKRMESAISHVHVEEDQTKLLAVNKYHATLSDIEHDESLNAKERRSAKRKAEAIALQETNMQKLDDLLSWYQENRQRLEQQNPRGKKRKQNQDPNDGGDLPRKNPYILFVGQIPFSTSSDEIFQHFQKFMGNDIITKDCIKIRIPMDEKTREKDGSSKQTKGFAFVEFQDPKLMHECLKMHHTSLKGRRINVIRAAGGGKASRVQKHKQRKIEQDEYISSTVDKIINEYIESGKLKEGELDTGSISLCKRRNAATVEAALAQYIEKRGDKQLANPSAFFTNVMCTITDDAFLASKDIESNPKRGKPPVHQAKTVLKRGLASTVDMTISKKSDNFATENLEKIFPSLGRGRGRGRGGYMLR